MSTLAIVIATAAGVAVDIVVHRFVVKRWIFSPSGAEIRQQMRMRWTGALLHVVGVPAAAYFLARNISTTAAGYSSAVLTFVVGFAMSGAEGNRNRRELDQMSSDRGYRIDPARAAWIDIGTWRRFQVARHARAGRPHPDTIVAAVANNWAEWMVKDGKRRWHRKLARRIHALTGKAPRRAGSETLAE